MPAGGCARACGSAIGAPRRCGAVQGNHAVMPGQVDLEMHAGCYQCWSSRPDAVRPRRRRYRVARSVSGSARGLPPCDRSASPARAQKRAYDGRGSRPRKRRCVPSRSRPRPWSSRCRRATYHALGPGGEFVVRDVFFIERPFYLPPKIVEQLQRRGELVL
jgi:hypothetical protein